MLSLPSSVKIFLSTEPTDMRKGCDTLMAIVQYKWHLDPFTGHLFVFISKKRNRAKVLFWDNGGFVLIYKRLEIGRFKKPVNRGDGLNMGIDATELTMLLDGIDFSNVRRPMKWRPRKKVVDKEAKI